MRRQLELYYNLFTVGECLTASVASGSIKAVPASSERKGC